MFSLKRHLSLCYFSIDTTWQICLYEAKPLRTFCYSNGSSVTLKLFFLAATIGAAEKVPFIRHDFKKNEWEAVGRVFVYSFVHLSYLPLQLSPAFIVTCLFEDEALTNDLYSAANDPRPQMIPRPEMIPKLDRK